MDEKAYIVFESGAIADDWAPIAVFLDEQKCDEFIKEKNKDWKKDVALQRECEECRCLDRNSCDDIDDEVFLFKDFCKRASISSDRYGAYCAHDMSDGYSHKSMYYSKRAVRLLK